MLLSAIKFNQKTKTNIKFTNHSQYVPDLFWNASPFISVTGSIEDTGGLWVVEQAQNHHKITRMVRKYLEFLEEIEDHP